MLAASLNTRTYLPVGSTSALTVHVSCMYYARMEHESKQKITFVLPRQLIEQLRAAAKRNRRSLAGELVWALEQYLRQQDKS